MTETIIGGVRAYGDEAPRPERWAAVITMPVDPDPTVPALVRRVGPYSNSVTAHNACYRLAWLAGTAAPAGTTIELALYDPTQPHLSPRPALATEELAEELRREPASDGFYNFPSLYHRLLLTHGESAAEEAWRAVRSYVSAEEEAAAERRKKADSEAVRLAPYRAEIARAAAARRTLVAAPILNAAAAMFADLLDVSDRHGAARDLWPRVANLPMACLMLAEDAIVGGSGPDGADPAAIRLVTEVVERCHARGIRVRWSGSSALIARPGGGHQPGPTGPLALALGTRGWRLSLHESSAEPAAILATYDEAGAAAVVDVLAALLAGEVPDPFGGRLG